MCEMSQALNSALFGQAITPVRMNEMRIVHKNYGQAERLIVILSD